MSTANTPVEEPKDEFDPSQQIDNQQPISEVEIIEGTLELQVFPVRIAKSDDPVPWELELREMPGFTRDIYLNKEKAQKNPNGTWKDYKNVQALLLSMTLFDKSTEKVVPLTTIGSFPATLQEKLYKKSAELNGFTDASELAAKNF